MHEASVQCFAESIARSQGEGWARIDEAFSHKLGVYRKAIFNPNDSGLKYFGLMYNLVLT